MIGSWSVDLATRQPAWSDDFYRLLGLDSRAAPSEETFLSVIHEEDRPAIVAAIARLEAHVEPISIEYRIRRPDGEVRHLRGHLQVARNAKGKPTTLLGALEDVTDEADAAEAVAASERRLRAITASALDAMVTIRFDGEITGWNPAAAALFGYTEAEILGADVGVLVPERLRESLDSGVRRALMGTSVAGAGLVVETQALRADGTEVPVEMTVNTWDANGEQFITGFLRDVSKRRSDEQRLEREHRLLSLVEAVAAAANATDRLDHAALDVLELVCRVTGWDLGHLLLVDDGRLMATGLWHVEVDTERWAPLQHATAAATFESGSGVAGSALATRTAQWVEVGTADALCPERAAAADAVGVRSMFAMPVLVGDEVAAVLELFSSRPGDLSDADFAAVMGSVGTQLGRVVERERAARSQHRSESRFRAVVEQSSEIVTIHGPDARVLYVSPSVERLLGHRPEPWLGSDGLGLIHPADRAAARLWFLGVLEGGERAEARLECRLQHADGTWRNVQAIASNLLADPAVEGVVLHIRDVTLQRAAEAELAHAQVHDPLTGLPMRRVFVDRLERALTRAERQQWTSAVLSIDIDHLREVNDEFGHEGGDGAVVEVARRLTAILDDVRRNTGIFDVVSRAGSDEFYLLVEDIDADATARLAERLHAELGATMTIGGDLVHLTVGIGVVLVEAGERDAEGVIVAGDTALRIGKESGPGATTVFKDEMRTASSLRSARETALRLALDRSEFRLLYQPKVALLGDRVVGVEALLRWEHPQDGPVPPLEFIPHAEASGLIVPIGAWALREACGQAVTWAALRPDDPISVAVNVSARQFDASLVTTVEQALASSGVEPRLLCLEITESVLMKDAASAARILRRLKALGVRVSVDDFGTGYSSLAYLKRFPIDELKIDREFVNGLGEDAEDTAIVAAVVAIAHALDVEVVAEGVETPDQLRRLRALGSDQAQGYLFSKAQPSAAIDGLLAGAVTLDELGSRGEARPGAPTPADGAPAVLIVDDNEELRGLARLNLTTAGFETHDAESATEALEIARRVHPTCVLVDLDLGSGEASDGFGLCRLLRADPATSEATIVIVTASVDRADRVRAFALGADDYIIKPFSPRDLLGRVRAAMARRADA